VEPVFERLRHSIFETPIYQSLPLLSSQKYQSVKKSEVPWTTRSREQSSQARSCARIRVLQNYGEMMLRCSPGRSGGCSIYAQLPMSRFECSYANRLVRSEMLTEENVGMQGLHRQEHHDFDHSHICLVQISACVEQSMCATANWGCSRYHDSQR
jgi:hypothetical protein